MEITGLPEQISGLVTWSVVSFIYTFILNSMIKKETQICGIALLMAKTMVGRLDK